MKKSRPPLFDLKRFLGKASVGTKIRVYQKGQRVFSQGDKAIGVFYIQSGRFKLSVLSKRAKEAVVGILGAGDFLGEECIVASPVRMASAVALETSFVMSIKQDRIVRLLRDEPTFSERFITHLLKRNIRFEADLVDHLFNSSEKRLARTLLLLAQFGKKSKPEPLIARISQETLAEMVGTTRSRVSHFMNKFRKLGFIEYNGGLYVHNSLLKVLLHE